jgi:hypothetical protein
VTALNRQLVREEIATGLRTELTGSGKPVSSVYHYQKGKLEGESPIVLVLSGPIQRSPNGLGAKKYDNNIELEIHILVYDGEDNNPMTEEEREEAGDLIEQMTAEWFAQNQTGTNYRSVTYTPRPTTKTTVKYIDGNPYLLEVVPVELEKAD